MTLKNDMIAQERAETQNLVIVRYWQINRLDRLYAAAEQEEAEDHKKEIEPKSDSTAQTPQLAIEASTDESPSTALIRLPIVSLGELDTTLDQIRESPKDMLRVSESVIDPLLGRWTRWQEFRDRQESRPAKRYTPSVYNLPESDEEKSRYYNDFHGMEESPRGYFLEGNTTDWRKPHSAAAKKEATRLRKSMLVCNRRSAWIAATPKTARALAKRRDLLRADMSLIPVVKRQIPYLIHFPGDAKVPREAAVRRETTILIQD